MTIRINCLKEAESKFKFVCPKTWDSLAATRTDGVKFCDECKKHVYLCNSEADLQSHAVKGQCAALKSEDGPFVVGKPDTGYGKPQTLSWED